MRELPEEIEHYRDRKWRREESLKVDSAEAVEAIVEDLGFCLRLTKAIDELQRRMKVVPQEAVYVPKFTYIWTLAEARFPEEIEIKMPREEAVRELAHTFLQAYGLTQLGELSGKFGFYRWESGKAN